MQTAQPNMFMRDDTFFGVCQALGEDLGFSPNILRVIFPVLLFVFPVAAIGGYAALGVIVAVSRFIFPAPTRPRTEARPLDEGVERQERVDALPLAA